MKKHLSLGLSAFALAALLSGCAGGGTTPAATTAAPATTAATSPSMTETTGSAATSSAPAAMSATTKLMVAESAAGQIVVDENGMSVYYFTKDTKDSGTSACTEACLAAWPPVITDSDSPELDGVSGTVGTIDTPDGKKQVTLNGMPLYYFAKDKEAGDILGQGVNSVWYLVAPDGEMITAPAGS